MKYIINGLTVTFFYYKPHMWQRENMMKKLVMLSVFVAFIVLFSGCIDDKGTDPANKTQNTTSNADNLQYENIPRTNLPSGITFLDVHESEVEIGNITKEAIEGIYRTDSDEDEVYIQIINNETPPTLIDEFKSYYKEANYDPFTEISINGHKATQVKYYVVKNGKQVPKYTIIWATNNSMIKVGGSTDTKTVIDLASATNS